MDNNDVAAVTRREIEQARRDADARVPSSSSSRRPVNGTTTFTRGFGTLGLILFLLALLLFVLFIFLLSREGPSQAGFIAEGDNCTLITCPAGPVGMQGVPGPVVSLFFFKKNCQI